MASALADPLWAITEWQISSCLPAARGMSLRLSVSAGWPDYPWASLFAMVTILCVLILEHIVSRAYERRLTRQLTNRSHTQGTRL